MHACFYYMKCSFRLLWYVDACIFSHKILVQWKAFDLIMWRFKVQVFMYTCIMLNYKYDIYTHVFTVLKGCTVYTTRTSRGSTSISICTDFRLLECNIPWGDQALMEQVRFGLWNDVKDLLLTFPKDPKSLTEAIRRVARCDNWLFERRLEWQQLLARSRSAPNYASIAAQTTKDNLYFNSWWYT
jgi:hypothetical protein